MAKLGNQLKLAWLKGMEAVGKGASNLASNAHLKVSEINLETRRREILSEFPLRAHDLWQKGVDLPEPLGGMLAELNDLDERLSVLRAQRYAKVEGGEAPAPADEDATANDAPAPNGENVCPCSDSASTEDADEGTENQCAEHGDETAEHGESTAHGVSAAHGDENIEHNDTAEHGVSAEHGDESTEHNAFEHADALASAEGDNA